MIVDSCLCLNAKKRKKKRNCHTFNYSHSIEPELFNIDLFRMRQTNSQQVFKVNPLVIVY